MPQKDWINLLELEQLAQPKVDKMVRLVPASMTYDSVAAYFGCVWWT